MRVREVDGGGGVERVMEVERIGAKKVGSKFVRESVKRERKKKDIWMRETIKYDILVLPSSYSRLHIHHLIVHSW